MFELTAQNDAYIKSEDFGKCAEVNAEVLKLVDLLVNGPKKDEIKVVEDGEDTSD